MRTYALSSEVDPAAVLAIIGDDSPLKPLVEQFGNSARDALAQRATSWFENRVKSLWHTAGERVSKSRRTPTAPRVQAAIEITKHGAAEERRDLRDAYENLAARSMTEDGRDHTYEEYARKLSKLHSGDLAILCCVNEETKPNRSQVGEVLRLRSLADLMGSADTTEPKFLGAIDRLELNGLLQISAYHRESNSYSTRSAGNWCSDAADSVHLDLFRAIITPLGIALLQHVADLDPIDKAGGS